jgi:hypothetical protein
VLRIEVIGIRRKRSSRTRCGKSISGFRQN